MKTRLETAAQAAEEFDKAYEAYVEAHPNMRIEKEQSEFYRMWTDENYSERGDDILK